MSTEIVIVCPYCGQGYPDAVAKCDRCGGLFEKLSRQATQVGMGPWYVRDTSQPFLPGFEFEILKKKIERHRVEEDTIIRGPTTNQFWCAVKKTPGVAHLAGFCHHCEKRVDSTCKSCPDCGSSFRAVKDRDDLGLSYSPPRDALMAMRARDDELCPICGNGPVFGGICEACDTDFAKIDETFKVGPWVVRDMKCPFRTGRAYEQIQQLAKDGGLNNSSVIRGPSTNQFWMLAKNVQGIAHLVGHCHSCGESVAAERSKCQHCGVSFGSYPNPNKLGLMYATTESAHRAQKQLELEQAQMNVDHVSLKPIGPSTADQEEADSDDDEGHYLNPGDESEFGHPVATVAQAPYSEGEPHQFDLDARNVSGVEQSYSYHAENEAALAAAGETEMDNSSPLTLNDFARTEPNPANVAAAREAMASRREKDLITRSLLLVVPLVVMATILVFVLTRDNTPKPVDDGKIAKVDPSTKGKGDPVTPGGTLGELRRKVNEEWVTLKQIDRGNGFGDKVDRVERQISAAKNLSADEKPDEAKSAFAKLLDDIANISALSKQRDSAVVAREAAALAAKAAKDVKADRLSSDEWDAATDLTDEAADDFDNGAFAAANMKWRKASGGFEQARQNVTVFDSAQKAGKAFQAALTKKYSQERIEQLGGENWKQISELINQAEQDRSTGAYQDTIKKYKQATAKLPELFAAMEKTLAIKHWAWMAGFASTDVLLDKAGDKKPDAARLSELRNHYGRLGLDAALAEQIPDENASYKQMADIIMTEATKQIELTCGLEARSSFTVGVQFRMINQVINKDGGRITTQSVKLIQRLLEKIDAAADLADYSTTMTDFIERFTARLDGIRGDEAAVSAECRRMWADMSKKMSTFDLAIDIVNR